MKMKANNRFSFYIVLAGLIFGILFPAFAQIGPELQMAELSKKLQLSDQQKKELTPIVEERDKQIKALKADTSMGKLQKLRKVSEIQTNFHDEAAKHLNADQVKKLEALQAERRAKLIGH
jgi:periplasmic protein CpxP/Spy